MIELINKSYKVPEERITSYSIPKVELMDFAHRDKNIRNNILILAKDPKNLKNDLLLYINYLKLTKQANIQDLGDEITIKIKKNELFSITSFSSITRARRSLYKEGGISYDQETEEKRSNTQRLYRNYYHT